MKIIIRFTIKVMIKIIEPELHWVHVLRKLLYGEAVDFPLNIDITAL